MNYSLHFLERELSARYSHSNVEAFGSVKTSVNGPLTNVATMVGLSRIPVIRLAFDVNECLKGNVQEMIGGSMQATKIIFIVGFFYG